ncbi:MAG: transcription termination/antitermination protein NusG [Alphaproteobacteria bacterium]
MREVVTPAAPRWTTAALAPGERWFVVRSAPRKELYAAQNLANQGFRPFLPRLERTVRHARRTRTVHAALFPRYLFVALDLERQRWRSIFGTFGVSGLVMDGERPRPVPAGVVEELAAAADAAGAIGFAHTLRVGDHVRFLKGPFAEMIGRLVEMDERGRVRVLLEILGGERVVAATPDALVPTRR